MQIRIKSISKNLALFVVMLGTFILTGWIFNITVIKNTIPGFVSMKPNTALCFLLSGITQWFLNKRERFSSLEKTIISLCALFITTTGLLTISEYIFKINLGIDELLFKDDLIVRTTNAGRMAPFTAFNFSLVGIVVLLRVFISFNYKIAQSLILLGFITSIVSFSGYLYGVKGFFDISSNPMALETSLLFMIVFYGLLTAQGEKGFMIIFSSNTVGGEIARKLTPLAIILPLFLGWLRLTGENYGIYNTALGLALFSIANIFIFIVVILVNAQRLMHLDKERLKAEDELKISNERFFVIFNNNPIGMTISELETGVFEYANEIFVKTFGYTKEGIIGKTMLELNIIDPEIRAKISSQLRQQDNLKDIEILTTKKNGETVWSLTSLQIITINNKKYILTSFHNITERKMAVEKFRDLLESAPDATVIINQEGKIQLINLQTEILFGYKRNEVIGREVELLIPERYYDIHKEHRRNYYSDLKIRRMGKGLELFGKKRMAQKYPLKLVLAP